MKNPKISRRKEIIKYFPKVATTIPKFHPFPKKPRDSIQTNKKPYFPLDFLRHLNY